MGLGEEARRLVGACGLNCGRCRIYQASAGGDLELQRRIALELFGEDSDVLPEQIACGGCWGDLGVHWSPGCGVRACAQGRGLVACSQCGEFPCPRLEEFYSKGYGGARENAYRQRVVGLEDWWREQ